MENNLEIYSYSQSSIKPRPIGSRLKNLFNKIRLHLEHDDDDWEIPFSRVSIHNFQGCGSQGSVYYGKLDDRPIAIKRLHNESLDNLKHLRILNHQNIVKHIGISRDNNENQNYILMEWCSFGTLHDIIHSGRRFFLNKITNFSSQIASGMLYLHSKGIMHRDLKPSNILFSHNDTLKISDFTTEPSIATGTYPYMAPEVIKNEECSFASDIWSYGILVWEILTGNEPYSQIDYHNIIWTVGNNFFTLPIPKTFPEGFKRILGGCWQLQPHNRLNFGQICMLLRGTMLDVDKISQELWEPFQCEWKRSTKDQIYSYFHRKEKPVEDYMIQLELKAEMDYYKAANKEINRLKKRYNQLYYKLVEIDLLQKHDKKELEKEKAELEKEKAEFEIQKRNQLQVLTIIDEFDGK